MPVEMPTKKDPPIDISLQDLAIIVRNEVELQDISVISLDQRVEVPTYQASPYRCFLPIVKDDVIPGRMQTNPFATRRGPDKKLA